MGDVVQLQAKKSEGERRFIFVCVCGCTTWSLFADGGIECASCGALDDGSEWRESLPAHPQADEPVKGMDNNFKVTSIGTIEGWLKRKLKQASQIAFAMVAMDDGGVSTFTQDLTDAREAWIKRRLDDARAHVSRGKKDGADG